LKKIKINLYVKPWLTLSLCGHPWCYNLLHALESCYIISQIQGEKKKKNLYKLNALFFIEPFPTFAEES
jgi:hypothetical protein